jgi:hypothetical protein
LPSQAKGVALRTLSRRGPPVRIRSRACFSEQFARRTIAPRIRTLRDAARTKWATVSFRFESGPAHASPSSSRGEHRPEDSKQGTEQSGVTEVRIRSRACFSEQFARRTIAPRIRHRTERTTLWPPVSRSPLEPWMLTGHRPTDRVSLTPARPRRPVRPSWVPHRVDRRRLRRRHTDDTSCRSTGPVTVFERRRCRR